ncbi:MAG: spore coat U domain-containing protein [Nevskiales bacterium]|nr:spore coat U domain-containing protein [Nevskiales bacterium]
MAKKQLLALSLIAGMVPMAVSAATVTNTFDVTITLQNACDVTTTAPTNMDFGTVDLLTSVQTQTSTITVTCTNGATYDVGIDAGLNEGTADDTTTRRMKDAGTNYVSYDLLQTDGTSHWGDNVGVDTESSTGTGAAQTFTVNGTVPIQTTPPAGSYSDTVTVTVTY